MAVDRETLVNSVTQGGQIPANSFTNPLNYGSVADDPDIAPWALSEEKGGTGYAAAVEMAQTLMADAGYPDGAGLTLNIGHNVSEAHAKIDKPSRPCGRRPSRDCRQHRHARVGRLS